MEVFHNTAVHFIPQTYSMQVIENSHNNRHKKRQNKQHKIARTTALHYGL